jgi:hypothetical protein
MVVLSVVDTGVGDDPPPTTFTLFTFGLVAPEATYTFTAMGG